MNLCKQCYGYGWYQIIVGNPYSGTSEPAQEQCMNCETFGHIFESTEEKALFILLTTDEEREGYFAKKGYG